MVAPFENSQLIHILSKNMIPLEFFLKPYCLSLGKCILIFIFAQISHNPYLDTNRVFYHSLLNFQ